MKKSLIASAIAITFIATTNVNANIAITSMQFIQGDVNLAATGSLNDDGTFGTFQSIDYFLGQPWTATQETNVISKSNGVAWAGTNAQGTWDYATDIANMADDQVAVGAFFNWNGNNEIPMLAVFDCVTTPGVCAGQFMGANGYAFGGMQTNPFPKQNPIFNGNGTLNAVPVPATVWLMGSGLLGLVAMVRRRKTA